MKNSHSVYYYASALENLLWSLFLFGLEARAEAPEVEQVLELEDCTELGKLSS
jgi:hypothetical protein